MRLLSAFILSLSLLVMTACSQASVEESKGSVLESEYDKLDLLTDYDREIWSGPDGWDTVQWQWKKRLQWDKECDYVGSVETYDLQQQGKLVSIMCVSGAYQPVYYLYTYQPSSGYKRQLLLGDRQNIDNPKIINGLLDYDANTHQLAITTLARGVGDCGVYRVFQLYTAEDPVKLLERRERPCSNQPLPSDPPKEVFTPKLWPLTSTK